jgi:hypothetical protein
MPRMDEQGKRMEKPVNLEKPVTCHSWP